MHEALSFLKPGVAYRRINRPPKDVVEALSCCSVADAHEAMGPVTGYQMLMKPVMRPVRTGQRAVGPAVTAFCYPGDNLMMHLAASYAEPGDIVVVNSSWSLVPQWGGLINTWAQSRGIRALVVDGTVRDTLELFRTGFPVWCTSVAGGHVTKQEAGAVNVPIVCAGVIVNPGDVVIAEDDGVIMVPRSIAAEVATIMRERMAAEEKVVKTFPEQGMMSTKYTDNFKRLGMREIDRAWDDGKT